jgi:hypothetical protein
VASNWLRVAADAVADRALAAGKALPADKLEEFVKDAKHSPAARRIAYEWLARVDGKAPGRLLPGLLYDPSPELRRDAVAAVIGQAQALETAGKRSEATAAWRKALGGACDKDQVDEVVENLKKLSEAVDVAAHFGFVRQWHLAAPFDNAKAAAFNTAYPPEKGVDLGASYAGKDGVKLKWQEHTTAKPYGEVDLNKVLGKKKGAIAYAYAVIDSPAERPVEIRAGSITALKIFLNGKEVFGRDEYHHGMAMDQHVGKATLKAGRNELLLKVCQNEQTEPWAQDWTFQVRLCDATGVAVPFTPAKGEVKP